MTKQDHWRPLGTRVAFEACGSGVALMRGVGPACVFNMVQAFIHARSIASLRGLDLQCTMGYHNIVVGPHDDRVSAVVLYAFARKPDQMTWEEYPDGE